MRTRCSRVEGGQASLCCEKPTVATQRRRVDTSIGWVASPGSAVHGAASTRVQYPAPRLASAIRSRRREAYEAHFNGIPPSGKARATRLYRPPGYDPRAVPLPELGWQNFAFEALEFGFGKCLIRAKAGEPLKKSGPSFDGF